MNCFRHHEQFAVGVCKSCMKGLCTECMVEVDNSLACKNSCEAAVEAINRSQENQPMIQAYAKAMRIIGPLFLLAYGIYVLVFWSGIFSTQKDLGLAGLGLVSILFGIWLFFRGVKKGRVA